MGSACSINQNKVSNPKKLLHDEGEEEKQEVLNSEKYAT